MTMGSGVGEAFVSSDQPIVLFDGACSLCNGWVRFVLEHERQPTLRFATLQSDVGRGLLQLRGIDPETLNTIVLVTNENTLVRSSAVLRILKELRSPYSLLTSFGVLPAPVLNLGYRLIARFRYRLFGRTDACYLPTPAQRARFLDLAEGNVDQSLTP